MPRRRRTASYLTSRRWTTADARAALAAWKASGTSLRAFAASEGLDAYRLYRWRRRLAQAHDPDSTEATPEFVELRPRELARVEVVVRSGRVLRVAQTIDASDLLRLVRALEDDSAC